MGKKTIRSERDVHTSLLPLLAQDPSPGSEVSGLRTAAWSEQMGLRGQQGKKAMGNGEERVL